jgi:hypothetical protein
LSFLTFFEVTSTMVNDTMKTCAIKNMVWNIKSTKKCKLAQIRMINEAVERWIEELQMMHDR